MMTTTEHIKLKQAEIHAAKIEHLYDLVRIELIHEKEGGLIYQLIAINWTI